MSLNAFPDDGLPPMIHATVISVYDTFPPFRLATVVKLNEMPASEVVLAGPGSVSLLHFPFMVWSKMGTIIYLLNRDYISRQCALIKYIVHA